MSFVLRQIRAKVGIKGVVRRGEAISHGKAKAWVWEASTGQNMHWAQYFELF